MGRRLLAPCAAAAAAALLLCAVDFSTYYSPSSSRRTPPRPLPEWGPGRPPSFAYWISGTRGDSRRVLRLLRAAYHPRNRYLLHLDAAAPPEERAALAAAAAARETPWREFRNVDVLGAAYGVDPTGPSALAAALHGAAVLLRDGHGWDWLVTLSASDYPLVTQDDLLYAFSSQPRDLNFIDHTSDLGWKEHERFEKLIIDPSLYMDRNSELFPATEIRQMPGAFKIFTGSPWLILSRNFVEYCVLGWDNLPRKLLMYFANTAYSVESYFQTLICNSFDFRNTTVNGDLRYFLWDDPPGLDPLVLNESHYQSMVNSSTTFARRFEENAPVLKRIDDELLNQSSVQLVPGLWCHSLRKEQKILDAELCLKWGDINTVRPGRNGERLRQFISSISQTRGCRS